MHVIDSCKYFYFYTMIKETYKNFILYKSKVKLIIPAELFSVMLHTMNSHVLPQILSRFRTRYKSATNRECYTQT